jgi:hypothetical protein
LPPNQHRWHYDADQTIAGQRFGEHTFPWQRFAKHVGYWGIVTRSHDKGWSGRTLQTNLSRGRFLSGPHQLIKWSSFGSSVQSYWVVSSKSFLRQASFVQVSYSGREDTRGAGRNGTSLKYLPTVICYKWL